MLIEYDRSLRKFFKDGHYVDLYGKVVLARATVGNVAELTRALEKYSATLVQSSLDYSRIKNWAKYTQPFYRKAFQTTYQEFMDNYKFYKSTFQDVHVKGFNKGKKVNAFLLGFGLKRTRNGLEFFTEPRLDLEPEDFITVTEAYTRVYDGLNGYDGHEYRAFVIDNEVYGIARTMVNEPLEVDKEVSDFVQMVVKANKQNKEFPSSYVVDVAEMFIDGRRVVDVISYSSVYVAELGEGMDIVGEIIKKNEEAEEKNI